MLKYKTLINLSNNIIFYKIVYYLVSDVILYRNYKTASLV